MAPRKKKDDKPAVQVDRQRRQQETPDVQPQDTQQETPDVQQETPDVQPQDVRRGAQRNFRADVNPGDQHAPEAARQADLASQRQEHNERVAVKPDRTSWT